MNPVFHDMTQTLVGGSAKSERGPISTVSRLLTELQQTWARGETLVVETLIERHPELAEKSDAIVRLIVEEVNQRRQRGEEVSIGSLYNRFPKHYVQLVDLLGATPQLHIPDHVEPPEENLGPFRLLRELGHGGGGRVYLAKQSDLANRLVVLKIIPSEVSEHLSLARLQHTNIVPLFGVHEDPADDRRALCMPFFGSTTLGHVMDALEKAAPQRRTGRDMLAVLEEREHAMPQGASGSEGPARHYLREASYVRAVCWIGACLADALHYAHQRGLLHLDIKPSNVLLASDGQPMLLDFHLASPPLKAGDEPPEYFGGTPVYMSPEQRGACDDVTFARPIGQDVDARADLYSLGMLLFVQLAGGEPSQAERTGGDLRRFNPDVSIGLADIIMRATAADPSERYRTAAEFAHDLRCHLEDKPLVGVPNRSVSERWTKWRRREPYALGRFVLVAGLLAALAGTTTLVVRSVAHQQELAQSYYDAGMSQFEKRQYSQAAVSFGEGRQAARSFGVRDDLRQALDAKLPLAERASRAQELHKNAEQIRTLALSDDLDLLGIVTIEASCKEMWKLRDALIEPGVEPLEPAFERQIRRDLVELAINWGEAHVRLGKPEQQAERRRFARDILAQCASFTPSAAVLPWYQGLYGDTDAAASLPEISAALHQGTSAWERYCLGRLYLKARNFDWAARALGESLKDEPSDYWPNYCLGLAELRRGRLIAAEGAFNLCIGLRPTNELAYYRRGQTRAAQKTSASWQAALADFDYALGLRPNVTELVLERGKARFHCAGSDAEPARMLELARDDLRQALEQGAAAEQVQPILAQVEEVLAKQTAPAVPSGGGP